MTITIKIRNKKAQKILEGLEEIKAIEIIRDVIPKHWSAKKKKQAADFLEAMNEAKLAEAGKIKLKTADSLINELRNSTH
jgi:hypothetical protein